MAAVSESLFLGEFFPSTSDFQPFDPHDAGTPTAGERTLHTTRNLTQTFQLASEVMVDEIDILFVRGTSGNTGRLRIFEVADTQALDITTEFGDANTNGFLAEIDFTMPAGLDSSDNTERILRLDLTDSDPFTLPATAGTAGYALNLSVPDATSEIFTWRFGDPGSGGGDGWYANGRVFYDDFVSSGTTEGRRDGLFAFNGNVVPEPSSIVLLLAACSLAIPPRRR
jgi:hypothetical protein